MTIDTRIKSTASSTSFNSAKYIDIGELNTAVYRSFIYFDSIPETFNKAILSLYWYYPAKKTSRDIVIEVYRPSKVWVADQVTWTKANTSTAWTKKGGDWIDALDQVNGKAPFGSLKIPAGSMPSGFIKIDITPLIKLYAKGTANTGILLKTKDEYKDYIAFSSQEMNQQSAPMIDYIITEEPVPENPDTNIVYVSNTGDSDFTCDGKDDDIEINQALTYAAKIPGSRVYLRGPYTYYISNSILLPSSVTLSGDSTAIVKIAKGLPDWGYRKCPISQEKAIFMVKGSSAKDIGIENITVDGSQSDFYPNVQLGTSRFNMATLINVTGLTIKNVTWRNGCNDAILLNKCSNILIDNIIVNKCGHDGVYVYNANNVTVSNSRFINRTNSSVRFYNLVVGKFLNNDCTTAGGGYAGLELEGIVKNIEVTGNRFHGLVGPDIAYVNCTQINLNIHDNVFE